MLYPVGKHVWTVQTIHELKCYSVMLHCPSEHVIIIIIIIIIIIYYYYYYIRAAKWQIHTCWLYISFEYLSYLS